MRKEKIKIITVRYKGGEQEITLLLEYPDPCSITASFPDMKNITVVGDDFFSCLAELRKEVPDAVFLCKGAKESVYPSRMSRQMGYGLKAYDCEIGKQATFENLVDIFNFEDKKISKSPEEQMSYHQLWLNSLKD